MTSERIEQREISEREENTESIQMPEDSSASDVDSTSKGQASTMDRVGGRTEAPGAAGFEEKKGKWNIGLSVNIVALATAFLSALLWFDTKIDKVVEERVLPHQKLLTGIALSSNGNYDLACEVFADVIRVLDFDSMDRAEKISVVDPFLAALAGTTRQDEYKPEFLKLKKIIDEHVPPNGDRHRDLGWVHLYFGEGHDAEKSFNESIKAFGFKGQVKDSADSHWGLVLTLLALGRPAEAIAHQRLAAEFDSASYLDDEALVEYSSNLSQEWYVKQLRGLYAPQFEESFTELISLLQKELVADPSE